MLKFVPTHVHVPAYSDTVIIPACVVWRATGSSEIYVARLRAHRTPFSRIGKHAVIWKYRNKDSPQTQPTCSSSWRTPLTNVPYVGERYISRHPALLDHHARPSRPVACAATGRTAHALCHNWHGAAGHAPGQVTQCYVVLRRVTPHTCIAPVSRQRCSKHYWIHHIHHCNDAMLKEWPSLFVSSHQRVDQRTSVAVASVSSPGWRSVVHLQIVPVKAQHIFYHKRPSFVGW